MSSLSDEIPIPPVSQLNPNLSSATEGTMVRVFGKPGALGPNCSDPTGPIVKRIKYKVDVGPWKVSGLDFAIEKLIQLFADVKANDSEVYGAVKSAGMLCVRQRRHNPAHYSNHSWGTAIDGDVPKSVELKL